MQNSRKPIRDKLDPRVMAIALVVAVVEFEVFTYARGVVKIAGADAWICSLLGALITGIFILLLIKLAARFPTENFFQYTRRVWGRVVAFIIGIGYLLYWFIYLILLFEDSNEANKLFFLPETPSIVTLTIFALSASLLAIYGLTTVIRFFQMVFPFIIIPLALIFVLSLASIDFTAFLPILSNGIIPVIKGSLFYVGGLQGLELILFITPLLDQAKKAVKPALTGIALIWAISFFEVISSIGLLGIESINSSLYPGFDAITVVELPGFPVQRFELFLTIPWIIGVFTTVCLMVYLLTYGIMEIFALKNKKLIAYGVGLLAVGGAYVFPNIAVVLKVRTYFNMVTLVFVFMIPIFTLVLAILRNKRGITDE